VTANERRRDYTVSRPIQAIYMAATGLSILVLLLFGAISYQCVQLSDKLAELDLRIIGVNAFALLGGSCFILVLLALGLGIYSIVHTHRMVGSSFRISSVIQKWTSGDKELRVTLRDGDYFGAVAEQVNELLEALSKSPEAE